VNKQQSVFCFVSSARPTPLVLCSEPESQQLDVFMDMVQKLVADMKWKQYILKQVRA
jgi:hypothetical protein